MRGFHPRTSRDLPALASSFPGPIFPSSLSLSPSRQRNQNSCLQEAPLRRETIKWELTCDSRLSSLLLACQVPGSLGGGQRLTGKQECLRLWGTVCGLLFYGGNSGRTKEVSSEAEIQICTPLRDKNHLASPVQLLAEA